MANKRKPLDKLTILSLAAQKEGLSYGKYMAKYNYDPPCLRDPQELLYPKPEIPENLEGFEPVKWQKQCPVCGKSFPGNKRTYCSDQCYAVATSIRQKEKRMEGKEQRYCAVCGKPLPLNLSVRVVTCSKACSAARAREWERKKSKQRKETVKNGKGGTTP